MQYIMDRIVVDDAICSGKPIIRGKRITVQTILEYLQAGDSKEDILYHYPTLVVEDIDACLQFLSQMLIKRDAPYSSNL